MYIHPCPICGRLPKIRELLPQKGIRRRMCQCPQLDGVIPTVEGFNSAWFIYFGDGDNNDVYKLWNQATERYIYNHNQKDYFNQDYSPWSNSEHLNKSRRCHYGE